VQFRLPPLLELQLKVEATLARKLTLPRRGGFGQAGRHIWRWRSELAERFKGLETQAGVARVIGDTPGLLAGFALSLSDRPHHQATTVLWLESTGTWTEAPEIIEERLASATEDDSVSSLSPDMLSQWLSLLTPRIRDRLACVRSHRWVSAHPTEAVRRVMHRLQPRIRDSARRHDARALADLERAIAFVTSGHTAGEAALVEYLTRVSEPELARLIHTLPSRRIQWDELEVWLTGLIVFGPAQPSSSG
jgi:hypothetical protein